MFAIIKRMKSTEQSPLIIGFITDLIFQSKIEPGVEKSGYRLIWIEDAGKIVANNPDYPSEDLGKRLDSPGADLIDQLTAWRPALLLFDLDNSGIPWRQWIPLLKSNPATRRIPIVCYGSHIAADSFHAARAAGADLVTARSNFSMDPGKIISQHIRIQDLEATATACLEPLSAPALKGLQLFNQGEYFEAHEFLEEAWKEDHSAGRDLYQAVLQVAVAYLQIERGNFDGAIKMFWRLRQWIDPLPDECRGVNVSRLRDDSQNVYLAIREAGRDRIAEFDRRLFRPVEYSG